MPKKKATRKKTVRKKTAATKTADDTNLPAVGKPAPAFNLADQDSIKHRLSQYRGQWVVLYFYPKDNTSGCTKQACQFRDARRKYANADAVILGVSPDSELSHTRFIEKFDLPFTLLADIEKTVCTKYGVWQEKSLYGRKFMGVVRTTFLIDPKGKVAHRWDKVKVADHEQDVLAKIKELKSK